MAACADLARLGLLGGDDVPSSRHRPAAAAAAAAEERGQVRRKDSDHCPGGPPGRESRGGDGAGLAGGSGRHGIVTGIPLRRTSSERVGPVADPWGLGRALDPWSTPGVSPCAEAGTARMTADTVAGGKCDASAGGGAGCAATTTDGGGCEDGVGCDQGCAVELNSDSRPSKRSSPLPPTSSSPLPPPSRVASAPQSVERAGLLLGELSAQSAPPSGGGSSRRWRRVASDDGGCNGEGGICSSRGGGDTTGTGRGAWLRTLSGGLAVHSD